jgi:hypothetical protein
MPPRSSSRKRRFTRAQKAVVTLSVLVLAVGLGNVIRALVALGEKAAMPDVQLSVSWDYLALTSAFWGVVLLACAGGLAWFRRWGRVATLAAVTLYEVHVWVDHLLFDRSDYAVQRRPWDLLFTLLLLGVAWGVLNLQPVRAALEG